MTTIAVPAGTKPAFWRRAGAWYVAQMKHILPPTIFFFTGFNLILWTKRMILQEQGIEFSGFLVATMAALVVGKAVLVTDHMPFMRRFDGAPLLQPILFKASIYWVCVFLVRLGEGLLHFLREGGTLVAFPQHLIDQFSWPRFLTIQVWLMVLFLVYVTIHELNQLFGDGELYRLFFRWRSSQAKLTRRQRIRLLTRLSRLTEATPSRRSATPAPRRTPSWSRSSARWPRRRPRQRPSRISRRTHVSPFTCRVAINEQAAAARCSFGSPMAVKHRPI